MRGWRRFRPRAVEAIIREVAILDSTSPPPARGAREVLGVFRVFLGLGMVSFGGPAAHLGYFRTEFVQRRNWLTDEQYADLVALCQFLPGPASSQVGFGLGLIRAGVGGALAAALAFALPSAVLMVVFAYGASVLDGVVGTGLLAGLAVVAVAIVAHAVLGMARTLAPDRVRGIIAVLAFGLALLLGGFFGQVTAIAAGAAIGAVARRGRSSEPTAPLEFGVRRRTGVACLAVFGGLLLGLPVLAGVASSGATSLADAFYRAGALVFGGGHVVLPLLHAEVVGPGWVTNEQFVTGYGAAQAVPGPLFTFAGYLGAVAAIGPGGVGNAVIALAFVFLPAYLLLVGVLPFWERLRVRTGARAVMRGANAAVLGILAAALYDPVFTTAIVGPGELALGVVCFVLLVLWRAPAWSVVLVGALGGVVIGLLV